MSGGDLEGGRDGTRNAEVAKLKELFYKEETVSQDLAELGLLRDVPIARFQMVLLPHQQAAFNIFQPQLVHMFEMLLATPKPWLYMHAWLPGGADNLGNPEYALPGLGESGATGPKATLQGVLMQVATAKRMPDARIVLTVQALGRALVVRGTQDLPYSRADVQLLPDAEQLAAAARTGARWRRDGVASGAGGRAGGAGDCGEDWLRRAVLAAAVAEEGRWRPYEFAAPSTARVVALDPYAACLPSRARLLHHHRRHLDHLRYPAASTSPAFLLLPLASAPHRVGTRATRRPRSTAAHARRPSWPQACACRSRARRRARRRPASGRGGGWQATRSGWR